MDFLSIFITWQFLMLCTAIAAITFVIRTLIEYVILNNPKMPGNSKSRFWRDMVLVILPIGLGILFAAIGKSFPYPEMISEPYSKFLFSASAGLFSPTLYRVIKALFWRQAGGDQQYQPQPQPYQPQPNFPTFPTFPSVGGDQPAVQPPMQQPGLNNNVGEPSDPTDPQI